ESLRVIDGFRLLPHQPMVAGEGEPAVEAEVMLLPADFDIRDAAPSLDEGLWIVRHGTLRSQRAGRLAIPRCVLGGPTGGCLRSGFLDTACPRGKDSP